MSSTIASSENVWLSPVSALKGQNECYTYQTKRRQNTQGILKKQALVDWRRWNNTRTNTLQLQSNKNHQYPVFNKETTFSFLRRVRATIRQQDIYKVNYTANIHFITFIRTPLKKGVALQCQRCQL